MVYKWEFLQKRGGTLSYPPQLAGTVQGFLVQTKTHFASR